MTHAGIDYGMGMSNIDRETGIRYGVINQNEVLQAWADSSEAQYVYACPYCGAELKCGPEAKRCPVCYKKLNESDFDCLEPASFTYDQDGYICQQSSDDPDIFIIKSPFYTICAFCSPCAPGAGYIMTSVEAGIKAYCFGHDWFDNEKPCDKCYGTGNVGIKTYIKCLNCNRFGQIDLGAPYKVYDVKTGKEVNP